MFNNLRDYFRRNRLHKEVELINQDLSFCGDYVRTDILDLTMNYFEKIEVFCLILILISISIIGLGFLIYFNIIDIKTLIQSLQQCII